MCANELDQRLCTLLRQDTVQSLKSEWKDYCATSTYDQIIEMVHAVSQLHTEPASRILAHIANNPGPSDARIRAAFELHLREQNWKLSGGFKGHFPKVILALEKLYAYQKGVIPLESILLEMSRLKMPPSAAYFWTLTRDYLSDSINHLLTSEPRVRNQYYMNLLRFDILSGFDEAVEYFVTNPGQISVDRISEIFETRTSWSDRCDLVSIVRQMESDSASAFLYSVAASRTSPIVRYYAVLALIDKGDLRWKQLRSAGHTNSEFWKSLGAYADYHEQKISFDELRQLARSSSTSGKSHWHWLTEGLWSKKYGSYV